MAKVKQNSRQSAEQIENGGKDKVFSQALVGSEKNEDTHARACEKSCEHRTRRNGFRKIKLGDDDRCGAVRDKSDKRANEGAEEGYSRKKGGKAVFSDKLNHDVERKGYEDDEQKYFEGVVEGASENAVFAVTALGFAKVGIGFCDEGAAQYKP